MDSRDTWSPYQDAGAPSSAADMARLSELIGSNIQKIQSNVSQIQQKVGRLGTAQDSERLRADLHETQHSTNELAKDTNKLLKDLDAVSRQAGQQRQMKLQRERLTNELMVQLNQFQAATRNAAQKEKDSVLRARANTAAPGTDDSDWMAPSREPPTRAPQLQVEQNLDLNAIKEREKAIKQLESDIVDVNQIYKDLALMVHEQGEVVDSIEANLESAHVHVEQAATDTRKAANYARGTRRKKVFCVALVAGLLIIVAIALYFSIK